MKKKIDMIESRKQYAMIFGASFALKVAVDTLPFYVLGFAGIVGGILGAAVANKITDVIFKSD